jgi:hypothetical protein
VPSAKIPNRLVVSGITSHPAANAVYEHVPGFDGAGGLPSFFFDTLSVSSLEDTVALPGGGKRNVWVIMDLSGVPARLFKSGDNSNIPTPDLVTSWIAVSGTGTPSVTPQAGSGNAAPITPVFSAPSASPVTPPIITP